MISAVDLPAGVLALPEGADVEIVVQDALHRHDGPHGLHLPFAFDTFFFLALPLRHTGRGDALVGEVVGDLLVAPAAVVESENFPHDVRLGGDDLKLLGLVDDVAVGRGADPLAVGLAALDDGLDLLAGVGDGHLVDEELKLNFQPVIVVGKVDAVPDGDDAYTCVPQVLQLHKTAAVAAGEAGEVLDDEDVVLVPHQLPAHGLVVFPLLEGVAGAVAVLVEGQAGIREPLTDEVRDDGFLVFDGGVVPVQFLVHRDAAVARNVIAFDHGVSPPFRYFAISRSKSEMYAASCFLRNSS